MRRSGTACRRMPDRSPPGGGNSRAASVSFVPEVKGLLRGTSIQIRRSLLPVLHGSVLPVVAGMRRGSTMTSADFRRTPAPLTGDGSACRQVGHADTCDGSPRIRRMAFAAQALDLPMRMNEDGFVRFGSLTCPHRPCIEFLSVTSQL